MIIIDGTMGRMVPAVGVYGVIPAAFAAEGTSPSPLANDADLPGDVNTQWMWLLKSPLPVSGTTQANDLGGYAFFGAPAGLYTQDYRGFTVSPTGVVVVYDTSISTTVVSALSAVQQDQAFTWAVKAGLSRDQALAYAVKQGVLRDQALAYSIAGTVSRDQPLAWQVEQPYITSDFTISYGVLNPVSATQALAYGIRAGVQRDRTMKWAVRSALVPTLTRLKVTLQVNTSIK